MKNWLDKFKKIFGQKICFKYLFIIGLCGLLIFPILTYSAYRIILFNISFNNLFSNDWTKLTNSFLSQYEILKYIKDHIPKNETILTFRQIEMLYYTGHKIVRHLDPRLIEIYKTNDKIKIYKMLLKLGVKYIYTTNYMVPTFYNSSIYHLTADPKLCRLIMERNNYKLYKLYSTPKSIKTKVVFFSPYPNFIFDHLPKWAIGLKSLYPKWAIVRENHKYSLKILKNMRIMVLRLGIGPVYLHPKNCFETYPYNLSSNKTYHFQLDAKGKGIIFLYLIKFFKDKTYKTTLIWKGILNSKNYKKIEGQILTNNNVEGYRFVFIGEYISTISIRNIKFTEIIYKNSFNLFFNQKNKNLSILNNVENYKYIIFYKGKGLIVIPKKKLYYWDLKKLALVSKIKFILRNKNSILSKKFVNQFNKILNFLDCYSISYSNIKNIEHQNYKKYLFSSLLKGNGLLDIFIWFHINGKEKFLYLDRYFLPSDYHRLQKIFYLPKEAKNIQVIFRIMNYQGKPIYKVFKNPCLNECLPYLFISFETKKLD